MNRTISAKKFKPRVWTLSRAIKFCQDFQKYLDDRKIKIRIGLTGSSLYSEKSKKDVDIILYPCKTSDKISNLDVVECLGDYGFDILEYRTPSRQGDTKEVWTYRGPIGRIDFFLFNFQ